MKYLIYLGIIFLITGIGFFLNGSSGALIGFIISLAFLFLRGLVGFIKEDIEWSGPKETFSLLAETIVFFGVVGVIIYYIVTK